MTRPIEPKLLIGHMSSALIYLGFRPAFRSRSGSRYLRYRDTPFQIRISDHRWSRYNSDRQPQVIRSVALQPVPQEDIQGLALELAIRFLVQVDARTGALRRQDNFADAPLA